MRQPYPFRTPVDPDDPDVRVKVMVDMPDPHNMPVHLANEHRISPDRLGSTERVLRHLDAHLYAQFRDGSDHYHVKGESA